MQTITEEQKEQKTIGFSFSVHGSFAADINKVEPSPSSIYCSYSACLMQNECETGNGTKLPKGNTSQLTYVASLSSADLSPFTAWS